MSSEVGVGHISIFPVMTGFKKRVSAEVKSTGADSARGFDRAFKGTGSKVGARLGRETKRSFSDATKDLQGPGFKVLQAEVAKTTRQLSKARLAQQDSAGAVKVAEARLAEVMARHPKDSAQVIAAEERLASARRRHEASLAAVEAATVGLKGAQDAIAKAQGLASSSTEKLSGRLAGLRQRFAEGYREGSKGVAFTTDLVRASGRLLSGVSIIGRASAATSAGLGLVSGTVQNVRGHFQRFGASVSIGARAASSAVLSHMGPLGPFMETVGSRMASGMSSGMGLVASAARSGMGAVVSGVGSMAGKLKDTVAQAGHAAAGILTAAFAAASAAIAANISGAVARVDTLNNFPKVMKNLGYTGDEAKASIDSLDKGIRGLPTALDDIASTTQRLAPLTSSLGEATDLSLALNNALLAGGKGGAEASRAMNQYTQMLGKGAVDMQSWRTLQEVMPGQLNQLAKALLGPTANSQGLYDAMQSGAVSFEDFNGAILQLNKEGLDGFASFEQQARDATAGIGTAVTNLGTSIKRNVGRVIEAIGADKIAGAFNAAGGVIDTVGKKIADAIGRLSQGGGLGKFQASIALIAPVVGSIVGALGPLLAKLPFIGSSFTALTGPVGLLIGALTGLLAVSPGLRDALGGLVSGILGNFQQMMSGLAPVIQQVSDALAAAAGMIGTALAMALNALMPMISQVIGLVGSLVAQVLPLVLPLIEKIAVVITQLMPVISGIISAILPPLIGMVRMMIPIIMQVIQAIVGLINSLLPLLVPLTQLIGAILPLIISLFQAVLPPLLAFASAIISILMPIIDGLVGILRGLINFVTGVFTGNWQQAWNGIAQMFYGFVDTIKALISGSFRLAIESIKGIVMTVFAGAGSWLVDIGARIIHGLVEGIKSAIGAVKNALGNLTAQIPDWKGPREVDDVLLSDAGHRIMGGLRQAIEDDQKPIRDQLQAFTRDLSTVNTNTAAGKAGVAQGWSGFSGTVILQVGTREFDAYLRTQQVKNNRGL